MTVPLPVVSSPVPLRLLAAAGGLLAGVAVALFAYAAHSADPSTRASLHSAALFVFGHGMALAPHARRRLAAVSLAGVLLGTLLFSGSVAGHHAFGMSTSLAPLGGGLMILSWLLWAADAMRR